MGGCSTHGVAWLSLYDDSAFCEDCQDPIVKKCLKDLRADINRLGKLRDELQTKLSIISKSIDIINTVLPGEDD